MPRHPLLKKFFRWVIILAGFLLVVIGIISGLGWYYKPEITAAVHRKLSENINGEFKIDNISVSVFEDFPNISITLKGIYLQGLKYSIYHKYFLKANRISLNVSLYKLLLKEVDVRSVRISQAEVFIFRTTSGYTNLDVFKVTRPTGTDSASHFNPALSFHRITFNDVKLSFQDSLKQKAFGVRLVKGVNEIFQTDSSRRFQYVGEIDFERLQFNQAKGSYLLGQSSSVTLAYEYVPQRHHLIIRPSTLRFAKSSVALSGGFHLIPDGEFSLRINSRNLNYPEGLSFLPLALAAKLAKYEVGSPFTIAVRVDGALTPGNQPAVDVQFETKDAPIGAGKIMAYHVFMKGSFTNHVDNAKPFEDPNSTVQISSFRGIIHGLPLSLEAAFHDLSNPGAFIKISIDADARTIQHELDSTRYQIAGGRFISHITYTGTLKEYLDPEKNRLDGKLEGKAELSNAKVIWLSHQLSIQKVNASIAFNQNRFSIDHFSFLYNKSPVDLKGNVVGFVPFFTQPSQKGVVSLQVSSPDLDITPMMSKGIKSAVPGTKAQQKKVISDLIDKLYSKLEFELKVDLKKFQYKNFKARDLTGNLALTNNQLQAKPIKMRLAEGDVQVTLVLSDLQKQINPLSVKGTVQQAEIREFFYVFNNFNQHAISYQNLSGKISANISLQADVDDDLNLRMKRLSGSIDFSVKDGKLTNFAPMEKLSNFLFKNRDFADIQFAEIKGKFDIRGTELTIGRMEVQSNVISFFLEGRYSLADSTDLSIQFPLSNLKKRDKNYKPENVGIDSKVGPSVYLRARRNDNGNMTISYDPFKKFRKK